MRNLLLLIILSISSISYAQQYDRLSTIDFVQILNNNKDEAVYYYENNWKILRDMALEKSYIDSYQILEAPDGEKESFQLILITTYANKEAYDLKEPHFDEVIKEKGELDLMNEKKPNEFRKTMFRKEMVKQW